MVARVPLVMGGDGIPQQLQSGDSLTTASLVGNSIMRPTQSISSASGVLTIDLSSGNEIYNVALTENIGTITITNPPATGLTAEIAIVFTQADGAYTVVNNASGKWHGGFSPMSTVNGAVESWGYRINSSGTIVGAFQAGVQA